MTNNERVLEIARGELHVQADKGKRYDKAGRIAEYIKYVEHAGEVKHIGEHFRPGHHWCAGFVSWVLGQAGIPLEHKDGVGHFSCGLMILDLDLQSRWIDTTHNPEPGDIIFIAWDRHDLTLEEEENLTAKVAAKHVRHVGFVESFDGENMIQTIEGNWKNGVNRARRYLDSGQVIGFGIVE